MMPYLVVLLVIERDLIYPCQFVGEGELGRGEGEERGGAVEPDGVVGCV